MSILKKYLSKVKIIDVTVRDGLQSYEKVLSVGDRVEIVKKISYR